MHEIVLIKAYYTTPLSLNMKFSLLLINCICLEDINFIMDSEVCLKMIYLMVKY